MLGCVPLAQKALSIVKFNEIVYKKIRNIISVGEVTDDLLHTCVFNFSCRIFNDVGVETHHDNFLYQFVSFSLEG